MAPTNPDHDDNDNVAYLVYIPAAVFAGICPILVALRTWARLRRGGKMGTDDWLAIAALVFCLTTSAVLVASCKSGMGRHLATLSPSEKFETLRLFYVSQVTYKISINLTKCCLLFLYLRIFHQIRWFKFACWGLILSIAMYCIASVIATIFQCSPVVRAFDKTVPGTCIDNGQFWYANAGFSIATDVVILLLPMPLVYQLQIPIAQKLALASVFALGAFVVITSCQRVTTLNILADTPDTTYDITNVMWTIIEPNVAIICACLPMMRPFIVSFFPKLRSKYRNSELYYRQNAYGSRSQTVRASRHVSRADWTEISGGKLEEIPMSNIQQTHSHSGSQDTILEGSDQGRDAQGGIQKTVHVSVEFSQKN